MDGWIAVVPENVQRNCATGNMLGATAAASSFAWFTCIQYINYPDSNVILLECASYQLFIRLLYCTNCKQTKLFDGIIELLS